MPLLPGYFALRIDPSKYLYLLRATHLSRKIIHRFWTGRDAFHHTRLIYNAVEESRISP